MKRRRAKPKPGVRCPFCAVEQKKVLFRTGRWLAIRDRYPVTRGHILIVHREHVESLFDLIPADWRDLRRALWTAKRRMRGADGLNIGVNEGRAAGRTIDHLHVHVIPRHRGDIKDPRGGVRGVIPSKKIYSQLSRD